MALSKIAERRAREWLGADYDPATRGEIRELFEAQNWPELEDRFYTQLEFGTGGLRGVMAAGTNRMNVYTVAQATQGLANYINQMVAPGEKRCIAVSHDSRHNRRLFAETVAGVMAANGIVTRLVRRMRPTPLLSFAVRTLNCCAGIMITASHNPKEYNGYKVYWDDGAQVVPPHDAGIIAEVKKIESLGQVKLLPFKQAVARGLVQSIGPELDRAYLKALKPLSLNPRLIKEFGAKTKIVYTPLHGTGGTIVPAALKNWGLKKVIEVERQMQPDGDFPTAASPNPEEAVALTAALKVAKQHDADLVLATDPDADRVGIAVRERKGRYRLVTGNQLGALIAYYYCEALSLSGRMPNHPLMVTTIVTNDLLEAMAPHYSVAVEECLTGFKWIAAIMRAHEHQRRLGRSHKNYVYGYEESYGYLIGDHCRDKDAVAACCAVAELACVARGYGRSLLHVLDEIYMHFGVFVESQQSIYHPGKTGMERIEAIMAGLRARPPQRIGGLSVSHVIDYQNNAARELKSGAVTDGPGLPASNVLEFALAGGSKIFARPSGTEPKIKFYFNFCDRRGLPLRTKKELRAKQRALTAKMEQCRESFLKKLM